MRHDKIARFYALRILYDVGFRKKAAQNVNHLYDAIKSVACICDKSRRCLREWLWFPARHIQ